MILALLSPSLSERDELNEGLSAAVAIIDPFSTSQKSFKSEKFDTGTHLLDCLYRWIIRGGSSKKNATEDMNPPRTFPQWLLDLFGMKQRDQHGNRFRNRLPTASQLSKVGIVFKPIEDVGISAIHYHKLTLQLDLPRLVVKNRTEAILRNLLAYEQNSKDGGELTNYVVIMDWLIDTAEDVAILTKAHVIENLLGSDDKLINMWNDMCTNIHIQNCDEREKMTRHILDDYENGGRAMYMEFREKYFSRPWRTMSLLAALVLLLFSLLQTVYTIAGYYHSQP